jgi:hypothetical protein
MSSKTKPSYSAGSWLFALIFGIAFFSLLTYCGSSNVTPSHPRAPIAEWYTGGTLHDSTLGEWRLSTYQNKLASSADFATVVVSQSGHPLGSMDELKPIAIQMERCISDAAAGGKTDKMHVTDVAGACAILMLQ